MKSKATINTVKGTTFNKEQSSSSIYVTNDYSKFTFKDNRRIDQGHVHVLKKRIESNDLSSECPIKVTRGFVIRDGQHTFQALVELGKPIYYMFSKMSHQDVPVFNSSKKAWKLTDYLEYYVDQGVHEYKIFSGFMNTYNISVSVALSMVYGQSVGFPAKMFKDGALKFVGNLVETQKIADKIIEVDKLTPFKMSNRFVSAMLDILTHPEYKQETMLHKVEMRQGHLYKCATKNEYLRLLEKVYNYNNKEKLRFI